MRNSIVNLLVPVITAVVTIFIGVTTRAIEPQEVKYKNVTGIRLSGVRSAQCYDPRTGHYPCIGVRLVIMYRANDGKIWSVSTEYLMDGQLIAQVGRDFGPVAPIALRQLEPALVAGEVDNDPRIRELSKEIRSRVIEGRRYDVASDAVVPFQIEAIIDTMANEYYQQTRQRLLITSGTRDANKQAAAMYDKLELGDNLLTLYRNQAAVTEIKAAYDSGRTDNKPAEEIKTAMAAVITKQVANQIYVSRHLNAGAVDIRTRDLTPAMVEALRKIIQTTDAVTLGLEETKPPHFHVELKP